MTNQHDVVKHLEYLRQSLAQDQKPIGFFLSAGCPLAIKMEEGKWPLIPDVRGLTKWVSEQLKNDKKYELLIAELVKAGQEKDKENVEKILSFIRGLLQVSKGGTVRGLSEADLQNLEKSVCKKIVEKMNVVLPASESPYHKLAKWISSIDREIPIEIFTTNYDLLAEQTLEDLEIPYFDGFVGACKSFFDLRAVEANLIPKHWTRLWKIHGSINWRQELVKDQIKVYRSSAIDGEGSRLIYPSHLKYEQSRKMPYLALIDQLSRFIRQKSSFLILSGYSFNDEHLNDTIINALKANPTAMVLGLMFDTYLMKEGSGEVERYPKAYELAKNQHNLNIWTFDNAIVGTNAGEWTDGRPTEDVTIKNFIERGKPSELGGIGKPQIKLGDFDVFSEFLKSFIGTEKDYPNAKQPNISR